MITPNLWPHVSSTMFCIVYTNFCRRLYKNEATAAIGYDIAAIYVYGKGTSVNFVDSLFKEYPKRLIDVSIEPDSGVIGFVPHPPPKSKGCQVEYTTDSTVASVNYAKNSKTSKYRGVVYNSQFNAWQISTTALGFK